MKPHLRHNKTCLNCGTQVQERYCSHCGQENTEIKESFGHLLGHFLSDITHYDSKFFTSVKDLLFRPGLLTLEYNAGRRASYLNPVRMYVFVSAVFFIVLFGGSEEAPPAPKEAQATAASADQESMYFQLSNLLLHVGVVENKYQSIRQYDSIQTGLPDSSRENGLQRYVTHRMIRLRKEHPGRAPIVITQNLGEDIPKTMFILLPLFALYTGMFYRRRTYVYSEHVIFSLHFHALMFIAFLLNLLLLRIVPDSFWAPLGTFGFFLTTSIVMAALYVYLALALSRTYGQPLWISYLKALAIGLMYILTLVIGLLVVGCIGFLTA